MASSSLLQKVADALRAAHTPPFEELAAPGSCPVSSAAWIGSFVLCVILLVLEELTDQYVELFPECFDCVVSILPKLLAVLDLCLEQLPELLVVILKLLAFQCFPQNILSVV